VSQPRVRVVPVGAASRRVKSETVSGRRIGRPRLSMAFANLARSSAVEKSPAWGATPPRMLAFSSWTSPWIMRLRKVLRIMILGVCWLALCGGDAFGSCRTGVSDPHGSSRSSAVGGIFVRISGGGLKLVLIMASGAKISRWQK